MAGTGCALRAVEPGGRTIHVGGWGRSRATNSAATGSRWRLCARCTELRTASGGADGADRALRGGDRMPGHPLPGCAGRSCRQARDRSLGGKNRHVGSGGRPGRCQGCRGGVGGNASAAGGRTGKDIQMFTPPVPLVVGLIGPWGPHSRGGGAGGRGDGVRGAPGRGRPRAGSASAGAQHPWRAKQRIPAFAGSRKLLTHGRIQSWADSSNHRPRRTLIDHPGESH